MQDLSSSIEAKSDQLNAVDLMSGSKEIKIIKVDHNPSDIQQPTTIHYENENGRPYKPGLTMRRILIECYGKNGGDYVGKSLLLFRNSEITYGKEKVGGIEISHLSCIDNDVTVTLPVGRNKHRKFIIKPLKAENNADAKSIEAWKLKFSIVETQKDIDTLTKIIGESNYNKTSRNTIMEFYTQATKKISEVK